MPGEWEANCVDPLSRMILVKCFRPDRVIFSMSNFIKIKLKNNEFVEPPPFDLAQIHADSTKYTPLIFILSRGMDPLPLLEQFAASQNPPIEITTVSLGQKQGDKAKKAFYHGVENGNWV